MPFTEIGNFFGVMSMACAPALKIFWVSSRDVRHPASSDGTHHAPPASAARRSNVRREIFAPDFPTRAESKSFWRQGQMGNSTHVGPQISRSSAARPMDR